VGLKSSPVESFTSAFADLSHALRYVRSPKADISLPPAEDFSPTAAGYGLNPV